MALLEITVFWSSGSIRYRRQQRLGGAGKVGEDSCKKGLVCSYVSLSKFDFIL